MCGIAGIVSLNGRPVFEQEIREMSAELVHRGPDGEGYYVRPDVGLGMRRLSIIDVEGGDQPIANEDGSIWVVMNGEIYNFKQLRRELQQGGHRFRTRSDTEVIVHLYEDLGVRSVERLRGMFSFALWDSRRHQAFIARDRLGIKPLYYTQAGGRLIFASELKALLRLPEVDRTLDPDVLAHILTFLTSPASHGIIAGINKLEPAHWMVASRGRPVKTQRYWDIAFAPEHARSESWFVERLQDLLDEAVKLHMTSDVPLGAFLSGGLDSSSIVATMARHAAAPIKTFSIRFAESEFDEGPYARRVATHIGTDHSELVVEPESLNVVEDIVWHLDEPFGDSSAIPTYLVSKLAAEQVTVVLSGDGGDELFAGYDKYVVEQKERAIGILPAPARRVLALAGQLMPDGMRGRNFVRHFALGGWERYVDASAFFRQDELMPLLGQSVRARLSDGDLWQQAALRLAHGCDHWLSALQQHDLRYYLPLDILAKVDRMSMAHSIEARVPLLDHVLVEFAATIPPEMQLKNGHTKHVLKWAMKGSLPDDIIERRKHGFAVPLDRWFRGSLASLARDVLLSRRCRERGCFETDAVESLLERQRQGRPLDLQIWTLLCFELWCRLILDGDRLVPRGTPASPPCQTSAVPFPDPSSPFTASTRTAAAR